MANENRENTNRDEFDADLHANTQHAQAQLNSEDALKPGGSGKQGDQQEFTQDREKRRDKSHNSGDSDKEHGA
jgi:hypothetical protein